MSVQVLRVSGMPFNVDVWVVDDIPDQFTVYIDKQLITKRGVPALQAALRRALASRRTLDESIVSRTLRAITG